MTLASLPFTDAAAGVTVRRATESDTPGIVDAWYSSMMPDEPMTAVLTQGKGPERCEALTSHVEHCLEEGVSVVAVDVNTGAVAGALVSVNDLVPPLLCSDITSVLGFFICHVLSREHHSGPPTPLKELLQVFPRPQAILLGAILARRWPFTSTFSRH